MSIYMKPTHYTSSEGEKWIVWLAGPIDITELEKRPREKDAFGFYIAIPMQNASYQAIKVHSLAFDDPAKGSGKFPRWDCINGWAVPLNTPDTNDTPNTPDTPDTRVPSIEDAVLTISVEMSDGQVFCNTRKFIPTLYYTDISKNISTELKLSLPELIEQINSDIARHSIFSIKEPNNANEK